MASSPRRKIMISAAPSCLNSGFRLPLTRAAAERSFARRSSFTLVPTGVMTILLPSKLNDTSLPGATPAAMRMCLGMVTCPFSVTCMPSPLVGNRGRNRTSKRTERNDASLATVDGAGAASADRQTRLYFGSAVVPKRASGSARPQMGFAFHALLGLHRLYSRLLLQAARSRLLSSRG